MLHPDDFISAAGGACYLSDDARRRVLDAYEEYKSAEVAHVLLDRAIARAAIPSVQAIMMARHLRGDVPAYPPFVMTS